jgi:hypothetical protein
MPSTIQRLGIRTVLGLGSFVLIWSSLSLAFDVIAGWSAVRQIQAIGFPNVPGQILKCEIKEEHGHGGSRSYRVEVEYAYRVAGIRYTSTTYRKGYWSGPRNVAETLAASLQLGKVVDVHYNPRDPADAVLKTGIDGTDLFVAMFMTPFNVIMLGCWAGLWHMWRFGSTGGARLTDDGVEQRVEVAGARPVIWAFAAAGAAAFILIFVVGFSAGILPLLPMAVAAWTVILIAAATAWIWTARAVASSPGDLVIDRVNRTLTLPVVGERQAPLTVSWSSISDFTVERPAADSRKPLYVPVALLTWPDGSSSREKLAQPRAEWSANALATWLAEQLLTPRSVSSQ